MNCNEMIQLELPIMPPDFEDIYLDQQFLRENAVSPVASFHTPLGIKRMDEVYGRRIRNLKEDPDKLETEILSNPHLHPCIKENLMLNLKNYRKERKQ